MAGPSFTCAAKWIDTQLKNQPKLLTGVAEEVSKLQQQLNEIQLSHKRYREQTHSLIVFENEIREIAFYAEDVIDEYLFNAASREKVSKTFRHFRHFSEKRLGLKRVNEEIRAIRTNIEKADKRLKQYVDYQDGEGCSSSNPMEAQVNMEEPKLDSGEGCSSSPSVGAQGNEEETTIDGGEGCSSSNPMRAQECQRQPSSSRNNEEEPVFGLEKDIDKLVDLLTCSNDQGNEEKWVVSIVGIGGIGKTTLAEKVYLDTRVKKHFEVAAWIFIPKRWNKEDVMLSIFSKTVGVLPGEDWDPGKLEAKIKGFLRGKLYLIVLDSLHVEAWRDICHVLPHHGGSKVLITTRNRDLSLYVDGKFEEHEAKLLKNEEQRWKLFRRIAIERKGKRIEEFGELGKQMSDKCHGLPLGMMMLAGLLGTKDISEWEPVDSAFTSIIEKYEGASETLLLDKTLCELFTLCYHNLPSYLKQCFIHLALFPENVEVPTGMLTRMWIAEGFVDTDGQSCEAEEVATGYLEELIERCLVQKVKKSYTGKVKLCRLHNRIREFCIEKANEESFLEVIHSNYQEFTSTSTQIRRAAVVYGSQLPKQYSNLRSLNHFGECGMLMQNYSFESELVRVELKPVCENFKLLRVLNLWGIRTHDQSLPAQLGDLIHLRYLGLVATDIKLLPRSIGNLCNLLTLDYRRIVGPDYVAGRLPNVLGKMQSLEHLYLESYIHIVTSAKEPLKLDALKKLKTLKNIAAGDWMIQQMGGLSSSLRKLGITGISNQQQLKAVFQCPSILNTSLLNLQLSWDKGVNYDIQDLRLLRSCEKLKKLVLSGKIEKLAPIVPPNLLDLSLKHNSLTVGDMKEAIGKLDSLKYLSLQDAYDGKCLTFGEGVFPELECLALSDMPFLEEIIIENDAMPHLKKLEIDCCRQLKTLPEGLEHVELQHLSIIHMPKPFGDELKQEGSECYKTIQHIPLLEII